MMINFWQPNSFRQRPQTGGRRDIKKEDTSPTSHPTGDLDSRTALDNQLQEKGSSSRRNHKKPTIEPASWTTMAFRSFVLLTLLSLNVSAWSQKSLYGWLQTPNYLQKFRFSDLSQLHPRHTQIYFMSRLKSWPLGWKVVHGPVWT